MRASHTTRSHRGQPASKLVHLIRAIVAIALALIGLSFLCATPIAAQTVRGVVSERATQQPIEGVLVSLLDESRQILVTVLTDAEGAFEMRAPKPGTYYLDAKRIGAPRLTSEPFLLGAGEVARRVISLDRVVVHLPDLEISGGACGRAADAGNALLELWDDARAALRTSQLPTGSGDSMTVNRFVREVDLRDGSSRDIESRTTHQRLGQAFGSLSPSRLQSDGYVVAREVETTDFYAPDAEVILSGQFQDDHCFSLAKRDHDGAAQVGIAFSPAPDREKSDISGVIWLDAATAKLRELTFTYEHLPRQVPDGKYGGRVAFRRLPTGRWIVSNWVIRMPAGGTAEGRYVRWSDRKFPKLEDSHFVVTTLREEGGTVHAEIAQLASIAGTVFDSLSNAPAAGATVRLEDGHVAVGVSPDGRFSMTSVPSGARSLLVESATLDSLGIAAVRRRVQLYPGQSVLAHLAIPGKATVAGAMCADAPDLEHNATIRLILLDAQSGKPLSGRAFLWWRGDGAATLNTESPGSGASQAIQLDSAGAAVGCDLPPGRTIHIESLPGAAASWSDSLRVEPGEVGWRVRRVKARTGEEKAG